MEKPDAETVYYVNLDAAGMKKAKEVTYETLDVSIVAALPSAPASPRMNPSKAAAMTLGLLCLVLLAGVIGLGMELTEKRSHLSLQDGWLRWGSSYYYFSNDSKTWNESRGYCRHQGADLVIINSREEQDFLTRLKSSMWIGLNDGEEDGQWEWVDGTPLTTAYWAQEQPGNGTCVETYKEWWYDSVCNCAGIYVCEKVIT